MSSRRWRNVCTDGLRTGVATLLLVLTSGVAQAQWPPGLDTRPPNPTCLAPPRQPLFAPIPLGFEQTMALNQDGRQATVLLHSPDDPSIWYLATKPGLVLRIAEQPGDDPLITRMLDIRFMVEDSVALGLLGMALHPDFASNGQMFLSYVSDDDPWQTRVSRFTSSDGGLTLDLASEEIIKSHDQTSHWYNSGGMAFGPDGYLYLAFGQGGEGRNSRNTANWHGSFLRIDVDGGVPFGIPPDNPLVEIGGGLPEMWAWGFRNPWRWSFDRLTGEIWVGDVGTNRWEEIDKVLPGHNYGWPTVEANECTNPPCDPSQFTPPVVQHFHADHGGDGKSIVGGYVYRGSEIPELYGIYIYGDINQNVWGLFDDGEGNLISELIARSPISMFSFAEDQNGELYVIGDYGPGRVFKLVSVDPPATDFPQTLSATGCVDPLNPTQPLPGLIPYTLNSPLWSDGTAKDRWIAVPDGSQVNINVDDNWVFPIGSVLMKNFRYGEQLIETRLLVRHDDGAWAGYSYEWDEAQTDATLLEGGNERDLGGFIWNYPSRTQCFSCHRTGRSLGPATAQLNIVQQYPQTGRLSNQLETLDHIGLLDPPLSVPASELPALPWQPAYYELLSFEPHRTLDGRARSYLHANCAHCHGPGGINESTINLSYKASNENMKICNERAKLGDFGIPNPKIMIPGDPASSILSLRMHTLGEERMPPLGSGLVDPLGVALIDAWIESWLTDAGGDCLGPDSDGDGLVDEMDNCPSRENPGQEDADADGVGDLCDLQCADGIDNDGDGQTDYPEDTTCDSEAGFEALSSCGLGSEGVFAVAALAWLRRRLVKQA